MLSFEGLDGIFHKLHRVLFTSFTCTLFDFASKKMIIHHGWGAANPDVQFRSLTKEPWFRCRVWFYIDYNLELRECAYECLFASSRHNIYPGRSSGLHGSVRNFVWIFQGSISILLLRKCRPAFQPQFPWWLIVCYAFSISTVNVTGLIKYRNEADSTARSARHLWDFYPNSLRPIECLQTVVSRKGQLVLSQGDSKCSLEQGKCSLGGESLQGTRVSQGGHWIHCWCPWRLCAQIDYGGDDNGRR